MKAKIVLGDIHVSSIDSASGIFISQINKPSGWRSQTKINGGFGDIGDHNHFENCISIVSDDDVIDSPMEDNSVVVDHDHSSGGDTDIHYNDIKVNTIDQNSTISIGESSQSGWAARSKNNYGNGKFVGDTTLPNNRSIVKDDDIVDAPVSDHHITSYRTE